MRKINPLTRRDGGLLVDPATIRDCDLGAIRQVAFDRVQELAPKFGEWIYRWCDTEQAARAEGTRRTVKHASCVPPIDTYSDRELGQALQAIVRLAFLPAGEAFGQFVDRLLMVIGEHAGDRLEARPNG
jgi:hypothetical protein